MSLGPKRKKTREKAQRKFTNRESFVESFELALEKLINSPKTTEYYHILTFYGVGGAGKSELLSRKLKPIASEKGQQLIKLEINFENPSYREKTAVYRVLRDQAKKEYGIRFPSFELAFVAWWGKANPMTPIQQGEFAFDDEGGLASELVAIAGNLPWVSLIPHIHKTATKIGGKISQWYLKKGRQDLLDLDQLEAYEIESRLHWYLAEDLANYLRDNNKSLIVFIDTYEALWRDLTVKMDPENMDIWVRDLVQEFPGSLWVVAGRDKLLWEEDDSAWGSILEQHLIGDLSPLDALSFLKSCGIEKQDVLDAIIIVSRQPFYLDIMVDSWEEIRTNRDPKSEDFTGAPKEVLDRFIVNYLDKQQKPLLRRLAVARFWDLEIGRLLLKEYTGLSLDELDVLNRFSFVNQVEEGKWVMHDFMRHALLSGADERIIKETQNYLFHAYDNKLQDLDLGKINKEQEEALAEAFYFGQHIKQPYEFLSWFIDLSRHYRTKGLVSEAQKTINKALEIAKQYNFLDLEALLEAELGHVMRATVSLEKAIACYNKAIVHTKSYANDTLRATCHLRLGDVLRIKGNFDECEENYNIGYELHKISNNPLGIGDSLECLGDSKRMRSDFNDALKYYHEALTYYDQSDGLLGKTNVTQSIADVLVCQMRWEEAKNRYLEALSISKTINDIQGLGNCELGLATIYFLNGDLKLSSKHTNNASKLFREINDPLGEANADILRSELSYTEVGYETSIDLLNKCIEDYSRLGVLMNRLLAEHRKSSMMETSIKSDSLIFFKSKTGKEYDISRHWEWPQERKRGVLHSHERKNNEN